MYLHSPFNGPSLDVDNDFDAMMSDTSGHLGRAQLQRHLSNSSSRVRRGLSRISKPTSAGSSPQPLQRRRATTQTTPRQRTSLYQQCLQVPEVTDSSVRPVSWHPSTLSGNQAQQPSSSSRFSYGSLYTPYSAYAFDNNTTPGSQVGVNSCETALSTWNYGDGLGSLYEPSQDYQISEPNTLGPINTPNEYFDKTYSLYTSPLEQVSESYPIFSPVPYAPSTWTSSLSAFSNQTAPTTPDFLPSQEVSVIPQDDTLQQSSLPKKESQELIGMGLYDGPDRNSWSLDSMLEQPTTLFASQHQQLESTGKGLKLEETWEPPEEDDDSEDEEEAEEDSQEESQCQPNEEDEEIFRLAEGALGLGPANTTHAQRPISIPGKLTHPVFDRFGSAGMWQGQLADYCIR